MVAFQPTFRLMLVSLSLVILLALQSTPALANQDGLHVDNAIRRHAARAGRMSKRFPPASGSTGRSRSVNRRDRHRFDGLTPSEIDQLLEDEQMEDTAIYVPASNSTNSTDYHHHNGTRNSTYSSVSSNSSPYSYSLPSNDSSGDESSSDTQTSSSSSTSAASTSTHSSTHSSSSTSSATSTGFATTTSHSASSTGTPSSSTSGDGNSSPSSSDTTSTSSDGSNNSNNANSNNNDNIFGNNAENVFGDLFGNTSSSTTSSSTTASQQGGSRSSVSPSSTSSSSSSTPTQSSLPNSPQSYNNGGSGENGSNQDAPAASSSQSQPDFYGFTTQPTSTQSSASPTSTGLLQPLVQGLGLGSSTSSSSASPTTVPSNSNSGSNGGSSQGSSSDDGSDSQSSTDASSTTSANGSTPTQSSDGSGTSDDGSSTTDGGAGSSTTSAGSAAVTTGPTSTTQASGSVPTGASTDDGSGSGSGSGSSAGQLSTSFGSVPTSTASGDDSGSDSGSSSSSAASSSTATTNPYWYANTQSLNLAPSSTLTSAAPQQTSPQNTGSTTSSGSDGGNDGSTDSSDGTSTASPSDSGSGSTPAATQDLPTTIVPSADSYNQPADTTSVGLLFKQDMQWTYVISQADLTAQIFAFMPDLVGQSVSLDSSKVSTVKLASYSTETNDTASTDTLSTARTLYMAYVPTSAVEDLQAMVSNTSSPFYTAAAPGAPQQLASQVDSTFNILSVAGQVAAGSKQKVTSGSKEGKQESTLRNSLIGVGCGLAAVFALVAGGMVWRKQKKDKEEAAAGGVGGLSRAHTIRSFSGGLRETWAPDVMDQHRGEMQQVWMPHDPHSGAHGDGFGGFAAPVDPFQEAVHTQDGGYVNMNRSSRMTERSAYSNFSQMTEAQRIQFDYESSRRSYHSGSDHSSGSAHSQPSDEGGAMLSTYQEEYRVPQQHTNSHAFGQNGGGTRSRRRGSVASSTIGRPEMMSNSVLL